MAQQLDPSDLLFINELIVSKTIQLDTMYQLFIEKRYFSEAGFLTKMKDVQQDYQSRSSNMN